MGRIHDGLAAAQDAVPVALFCFWVSQFVLWIAMMLVVQFVDPGLGQKVLYVTQISHWALVESAGTAAIASWALIQGRHNHQAIAAVHDHVSRSAARGDLEAQAIERDIARLAALEPGPEGQRLAGEILVRLKVA